jgi:hypothetical protein
VISRLQLELEDSRPAALVARREHPTGSSDALRRYGTTVAGRVASGTGRVGSRIDDQCGNHAADSSVVVWHDVSLKTKDELFPLSDKADRVQETYLCSDFNVRKPQKAITQLCAFYSPDRRKESANLVLWRVEHGA